MPQNQSIKITKKKYLLCPGCKDYTRLRYKSNNLSYLGGPGIIATWFSGLSNESKVVCIHCDNKKGYNHVFLDTEISEKGKEIAYFTPEGVRKLFDDSSKPSQIK